MKKLFALILSLTMILAVFSACGSTPASSEPSAASVPSEAAVSAEEQPESEESAAEAASGPEASAGSESSAESEEPEEVPVPDDAVSFPLEETETLTLWCTAGSDVTNMLEGADLDNLPALQYQESLTNVHIDTTAVMATEMATNFSLMVASGDYTDLIHSAPSYYNGGGTAAVDDGVILDIKPYMDEGYTPHYKEAISISEHQTADAMTDEGYITTFLTIYENGPDPAGGLWIRKDWLDKVGKDVPQTYDELFEVLKLFKSECGASEPYYTYLMGDSHFTEGFGVASELQDTESYNSALFYQVDGEVHFAPMEDEWVEAMETMQKFYKEGLFGQDIANHSINVTDQGFGTSVCTGMCGVFRAGTRMVDMVTGSGVDYDPDFAIVAMADPTPNADDPFHYTWYTKNYATSGVCISGTCENVPLALGWLDYWYSPEGTIIAQYGEEGVSYNMENGEPVWSDLVTDNPDVPLITSMGLYQLPIGCRKAVTTDTTGWPDKTKDALEIWSAKWDAAYFISESISLTSDEAETFGQYFSEISTYYLEMVAKYLVGDASLDEIDSVRATMEDMGVQECIDVIQAALDRYNAR